MRKLSMIAAAAMLALPVAAAPAFAQSVTIRTGDDLGERKTVKKKVVRDELTGSTRVSKKVTRTNAFGDRVTKKTTREVD